MTNYNFTSEWILSDELVDLRLWVHSFSSIFLSHVVKETESMEEMYSMGLECSLNGSRILRLMWRLGHHVILIQHGPWIYHVINVTLLRSGLVPWIP